VTVTLYNRSTLSIEDQAWLSLLGHLEDLTVQERRTLIVARHEEGVTPRRLRTLLGESFDVDALISSAVAKGLLVREGVARAMSSPMRSSCALAELAWRHAAASAKCCSTRSTAAAASRQPRLQTFLARQTEPSSGRCSTISYAVDRHTLRDALARVAITWSPR
jgi:hypothetical protein